MDSASIRDSSYPWNPKKEMKVSHIKLLPCHSFKTMNIQIKTNEQFLVPPEPAEESLLGAGRCGGCVSHPSTPATKANGTATENKEDHRGECQPETRAGNGTSAEAEIAHLILDIRKESNINDEGNERQESSKKSDKGRKKSDSDMLGEGEQQRDERYSRRDRMHGKAAGPR